MTFQERVEAALSAAAQDERERGEEPFTDMIRRELPDCSDEFICEFAQSTLNVFALYTELYGVEIASFYILLSGWILGKRIGFADGAAMFGEPAR